MALTLAREPFAVNFVRWHLLVAILASPNRHHPSLLTSHVSPLIAYTDPSIRRHIKMPSSSPPTEISNLEVERAC